MAVARRGRVVQHWSEHTASPEKTMVWREPKQRSITSLKVPVVYYLSKNGNLEHPHLMEIAISSPEGLYLRDVIKRLNMLRGKEMPTMYSWSSKRSYKNGFVWHDLAKDDFIHPAHGNEYVLKGSELLATLPLTPETPKPADDDSAVLPMKKAPLQLKSFDLNECKVHKNELTMTDASTQTDVKQPETTQNSTTEQVEIEISPPASSSSPNTLETIATSPTGRMRASTVLMQLISCGSPSVKNSPKMSAMSAQYRRKKMAAAGSGQEVEFAGLRRSTSFDADRSWKLEFLEEEVDSVSATCIPRKPKITARKDKNLLALRSTEAEDQCRPVKKSQP